MVDGERGKGFEHPKEKDTFDTGAQEAKKAGKGRFVLISPIGLRRLAAIYELGAVGYGPRNWELGIPISKCLDSAERHINQYKEGYRREGDEDHLAQAAWKLIAAMHIETMVERGLLPAELCDLPTYLAPEEKVASESIGEGDRVRCVNAKDSTGILKKGKVYTVLRIYVCNSNIVCLGLKKVAGSWNIERFEKIE